ncbi:MAG TPA: CoA-binding protein [Chloroflexi bacterium]|nr:CoA-binding protein [Chloroflexota bacterium]
MTSTLNPLHAFFAPRGVVVVGASTDPTKLGYGVARNLLEGGFPGAVHLVNPKGGQLLGHPLYPSVENVPDPVDLAVILIPAPAVPPVLEACGRRGIRAAIVASGGFRETGQQGAELEAACVEIAQRHDMRLMGPNCIGLVDTHLPLDTTFLPPPGPPVGNVAFITHSGALAAAVIDWARGQGFGFSRLVSLGNQADVNETDILPVVAADDHTRAIAMYLESVGAGRRFVETARTVARQKPIVALKVGRTEAGQQAAASHTGALAGQERAFEAAFRRAGVLRAGTVQQMFQWAEALAQQPLPRGDRVLILTNAGGPGVTAADAIAAEGLRLARLTAQTRQLLQEILPPAASLHNPVDMLASASPEQYAQALRLGLDDPGVDMVMVILPPPPMFSAGAVARAMIPLIQTADKPVVVVPMGDPLVAEAVAHLRAARVPEYRFPEDAASALGALYRRARWLETADQPPLQPVDEAAAATARRLLAEDTTPAGRWLPPNTIRALLTAYGIPTPQEAVARNAAEAAEAAEKMGFPVALKVVSPDIAHKSDAGGVVLGLETAAAVAEAYEAMMARLQAAFPQARLEGALVQQMAPEGQEVIVGAVRDPLFGPLVMFGSGGVEVEGLGDVAFALAPLTAADRGHLLESTWAGRKLAGFRNLPPADRPAVEDTLARLAQLAADFPTLAEIEINPLRVLPEGRGVLALDVRARRG